MSARTWPRIPPSPIRRLPWSSRVPLSLVDDDLLEVLRHVTRGRLRRAVEREARLRDGSDRSGPRVAWRLEARA